MYMYIHVNNQGKARHMEALKGDSYMYVEKS